MKPTNPVPNDHQEYDHQMTEETPFFPFTHVLMIRDHTPTSAMEEMNDDFVKQAGTPSTTPDPSQSE